MPHRPFAGRRVAALALFSIAAAAALLFAAAFPLPEARNDAAGYLAIARNVAAGNGFTQDGVAPMLYRPPLFPSLLGGWFLLTGTSSSFSAAVFQSLEHAAGVWIAFLLFLEFAPSLAWAILAALFLAIHPVLVTRVAFVLQEPTLLLVTTLATWLSVRLLREPSKARAALAGAAWGLCTLAKLVAWFAPFLLLAMRFLPAGRKQPLRGPEAAILLACCAAVVAPWTIRNYFHSARFIPVNAQGTGMLEWNVKHAEIPGEPPGREFAAEVSRMALPDGERRKMLWGYVLDHPGHFFFRRVLRNMVHFAAPPRDWWIARGLVRPGEHGAGYWVLATLLHFPLYLLLLLRTRDWWNGRTSRPYGFLLLLYWAYWAEHAILWGDPRFGLAVYPVLVAFALPPRPRDEGEVSGGSIPAPA